MHSKYIVRDASTSGAAGAPAVWTGSTNFTDDAWTRQENNIIIPPDDGVAAGYRRDFDQRWTAATITGTGAHDAGSTPLGAGTVAWDFTPADGQAINTALADRITQAITRIVVAAMVLTSREVLAALVAPRACSPTGAPSPRTWSGRTRSPTPRPACTTSCTSRS